MDRPRAAAFSLPKKSIQNGMAKTKTKNEN